MEINRVIRQTVSVGALIGVGLCAGTASAFTTYDANAVRACQKSGSTGSIAFGWEALVNTSTTETLNIDCGDETNTAIDTNYVSTISLAVEDFNNTSGQNVSCTAKVLDFQGNTLWTSAAQAPSGSPGVTYLNWTSIPGYAGLAYVSCVVPKASGGNYSGIMTIGINQSP